MLRKLATTCVIALIAASTSQAQAGIKNRIKIRVNHMERVMGAKLSTWAIRNWQARYSYIRHKYLRPPHLYQWLCIHHYEGAWNDPNPPYFGGLQMDISFQRSYGSYVLSKKGTANYWTPVEQMWVAEHALQSGRGLFPWPNTAHDCGYI